MNDEKLRDTKFMSSSGISSSEGIIDEARNGRMFILVDDENRENQGDLVIPAQMATPDAINFMAMHGRGLICLALSRARVDALGLNPMSQTNGTRHATAFTTSIEARDGVTTGISAGDRARTIAVAIDAGKDRGELVSPGHVFPLVARDGGVLERAGHTEAAVDVARLAGLNPSGVICEIMNADGTMARLDDLMPFAALHGLKIGTIRDLIAYRRCHDRLVEKRAEMTFNSHWGGAWKAMTFFNRATRDETVALQKGEIDPRRATLVRMHTHSIFADSFGEDSDRSGLLPAAMKAIAEEGAGVIVVINRRTPNTVSRMIELRAAGKSAGAPEVEELRDYGNGAQILSALGVQDMILLTNTRHTLVGVSGYGLSILGERPLITGGTNLIRTQSPP